MPASTRQSRPPAWPRSIVADAWSAELLPRHAYCASYTAEAPVIGFAFDAQRGTHAFNSDRRTDFHTRPNGLAYVPQGCAIRSEADIAELLEPKAATFAVRRAPEVAPDAIVVG